MPALPQQVYYCRIRNCQRTCGLVHRDSARKGLPTVVKKSLSFDSSKMPNESTKKASTAPSSEQKKRVKRKARRQRSTDTKSSTTASNGSSGRGTSESQNTNGEGYLSTRHMTTFEEIMERAVRKTSDMNIEDTSPVPSISAKSATEKRLSMAPSVSIDTTTIHFDQPVWDNPELREELLDSEEEFALDAIPPVLKEDSMIMDEIISEATHAVDYNPIDHERQDEMISGWSSDDNDYSAVDLSQIRSDNYHDMEPVPARRKKFQDATYERSLDVADHS